MVTFPLDLFLPGSDHTSLKARKGEFCDGLTRWWSSFTPGAAGASIGRALGVTSKHRSAELPDAPPIADTVPGYESTSWVLIMGPAKIPAAVAGRLHQETVRALAFPDVKERLARMGSDIVGSSPDEARKFIRAELEKWAKTVKAAGIKSGQ